ncbi:hypothetical protein [Streptococcus pantholopis]|uniref:Uncharacterized protein n=1 Tax=Streptococcus pantholopis TaxID=1811193 RepID=A0A172Q9I0_9STRE|nr:hypothetical protein [Streptococcus pantholopis]AND80101.1 hypothetical protein A0O21_08855 [Streptococcus pantholopis]
MPVSEAQKKASRKWEQKNKEKKAYYSYKATTKSFIRNKATAEDLTELEALIAERRKSMD